MTKDLYPIFFYIAVISWIIGMPMLYAKKPALRIIANIFLWLGVSGLIVFLSILWIHLERPPLRTLGETRLWYATFLALVGMITYIRWKYKWFVVYSMGMSILFLIINFIHPENYDKTLMPALQSPWFVPHVIVYIFAYALLGMASLIAAKDLFFLYIRKKPSDTLNLADNIVYIGLAFLTMGLLFGALWAKEAWGHYWTWDPKETWALITWLMYLLYIHLRYHRPRKKKWAQWLLAFAFIILLICWFGVNYLPSAANSVHTY